MGGFFGVLFTPPKQGEPMSIESSRYCANDSVCRMPGNREFFSRAAPSILIRVRLVIAGLLAFAFVWGQPGTAWSADKVTDEADVAVGNEMADSQPSFIQRPQWEFGIGAAYFSGFDYPASNDENERSIALPFFIYRSPLLRFGGGGIRAVAIERPRVKLDLSVGGSLNASSEGNSVREGMPNLDFLFELGPQLEVRLFDRTLDSGSRWRGKFTSELRAVFSTDFSNLDARGAVAEFGVGFSLSNIAGSRVSLFTGMDVKFASERLQDYFYEVDAEFVTTQRSEFDAQAGYLETSIGAAIATSITPRVRVFMAVSQGLFDGAANQDSPLFETTEQTGFALGVVWTIKKSKTMIDVIEMGVEN